MDALKIQSSVTGTGHPTLLFVHGFCCDSTDWDVLIERLAPHFRCATLDLPGHGGSFGQTGGMQQAGEAVTAVKNSLGADNVVLIGHSLGAKIIREAYRQDPQGISGLVLVDGSLYLSDRETMLRNAQAAVSNGMEAFVRGLFGRMFDEETPISRQEFLLNRALSVNADFARDLFLDSVDWDTRYARSTLEKMTIPGLVVQATSFDSQFRWRPLADQESTGLIDTMREVVADFEAVVVRNAGHFVMTDNPEATAESIANFARRISAKKDAA